MKYELLADIQKTFKDLIWEIIEEPCNDGRMRFKSHTKRYDGRYGYSWLDYDPSHDGKFTGSIWSLYVDGETLDEVKEYFKEQLLDLQHINKTELEILQKEFNDLTSILENL